METASLLIKNLNLIKMQYISVYMRIEKLNSTFCINLSELLHFCTLESFGQCKEEIQTLLITDLGISMDLIHVLVIVNWLVQKY